MTDAILSDDLIATMSPDQRRELIQRLERPLGELLSAPALQRVRRVRLAMMSAGTAALIPWTIYLALTLPDRYVTYGWTATWVGFDVLLLMFMVATALLGLLRRQLVMMAAFTTGVLLICDAWFDVMTAAPGDVWFSVCTAGLVELPLAVLMITGALRILRLTANRFWLLGPHAPLWRVPLLP
jgi:hypothetical protein